MKKILLYFLAFLTICFFLPALFTKQTSQSSAKNRENSVNSTDGENSGSKTELNKKNSDNSSNGENEYPYKKYGTIQLLNSKTGQVEQVKLDEYLCNVISAEMPADYEIEALKAQAIVARTYTVYKICNKKHENADICDNSTCCQAWISKEDRLAKWEESKRDSNWQKICDAVSTTRGKIITYNNEPINAFFHSNSGGKTETPVNVWGGTGYPYLQTVETAGEDGYSQYASEISLSQEEIISKLKTKYEDISIDFNNSEEIKILKYTDGGRVKTIKFGNHELSGVEARSIFGLKSANFEITKENNQIKFSVKGYGHGVGMSQTGADAMAKNGSTAEDIIHHFYQNVEIKEINKL